MESMAKPDGDAAASAYASSDVSGALAWADACKRADGTMRAWIEDEADESIPMLWTASLLLLRHLEAAHPADYWRGRRVLEFGSGAGHLAVGLARLGAHVVATESGECSTALGQCSTFGAMEASTRRLLAGGKVA